MKSQSFKELESALSKAYTKSTQSVVEKVMYLAVASHAFLATYFSTLDAKTSIVFVVAAVVCLVTGSSSININLTLVVLFLVNMGCSYHIVQTQPALSQGVFLFSGVTALFFLLSTSMRFRVYGITIAALVSSYLLNGGFIHNQPGGVILLGVLTVAMAIFVIEKKNSVEKEVMQFLMDKVYRIEHRLEETEEKNMALEKEKKAHKEMALKDELTSLSNTRMLKLQLEALTADKKDMHVILLDIDNFKSINDTLGHDKGDVVLREVAKALNESLRDSDIIGRWGGEEFLAILPDCDKPRSLDVAERLRKKVRGLDLSSLGVPNSVTISLGVCAIKGGTPYADGIRAADIAMYHSKKTGKDKVTYRA